MDEVETIRRQQQMILNSLAGERDGLEKIYGQVWNTQELREDFVVLGFLAPYCVVKRKSDGVKGSLMFQHQPRFFFEFQEDE